MDENSSIRGLAERVAAFCDERDWAQFHNPKDLAIGIATEAGELLDCFRFKNAEQVAALFANPVKRMHIEDELSDVLFFVLRFAGMNGIDLGKALERKLAKNAANYPVESCRGRNDKHDAYAIPSNQ